jgi:hypothetical protein
MEFGYLTGSVWSLAQPVLTALESLVVQLVRKKHFHLEALSYL